jgi:N-acetylneuraminate synthase
VQRLCSSEQLRALVMAQPKFQLSIQDDDGWCGAEYPAATDVLVFNVADRIREVERLKAEWGGKVKAIGFSGHHLGIAADIAALTLGADVIERHFTLDRTWKGTDHAASLEPEGVRKLARDLKAVHKALTFKSKDILPIEELP